jgi:hypothetical protein
VILRNGLVITVVNQLNSFVSKFKGLFNFFDTNLINLKTEKQKYIQELDNHDENVSKITRLTNEKLRFIIMLILQILKTIMILITLKYLLLLISKEMVSIYTINVLK